MNSSLNNRNDIKSHDICHYHHHIASKSTMACKHGEDHIISAWISPEDFTPERMVARSHTREEPERALVYPLSMRDPEMCIDFSKIMTDTPTSNSYPPITSIPRQGNLAIRGSKFTDWRDLRVLALDSNDLHMLFGILDMIYFNGLLADYCTTIEFVTFANFGETWVERYSRILYGRTPWWET